MADKNFVEHVSELKRLLRTSIQQHLDDFERNTGMSPSRIEVVTTDMTSVRDDVKKYVVTQVRIGFDTY